MIGFSDIGSYSAFPFFLSFLKNTVKIKNIDMKVSDGDFKILKKVLSKFIDKKIAEALSIKQNNPFLYDEKDSYKLSSSINI